MCHALLVCREESIEDFRAYFVAIKDFNLDSSEISNCPGPSEHLKRTVLIVPC